MLLTFSRFLERLTDEQALGNKILRTMCYIESLIPRVPALPQENLNRVVIRRIEHLYFKVRFC